MKNRLPVSERTHSRIQNFQQPLPVHKELGYRFAILSLMAIFIILVLIGFIFMIAGLFRKNYDAIELSEVKTTQPLSTFSVPTGTQNLSLPK